MTKRPDHIDAEFRVVGEGRWKPFKRWLWGHFDGWLPQDWATYTPRERFAFCFSRAVGAVLYGLLLWALLAVVVWWNSSRY